MTKEQRKKRRRVIIGKVVAVVVVLAICAIACPFDFNPFGYIPLIAVITLIILAFVYLLLLKRALRFEEKSEITGCPRGEEVNFTVRFKNRFPLFFFRIEAYFYISDQFDNVIRESMTTIALAPFEKYDLKFAARFDHVGTHSAGLEKVVICDFLRLFTTTVVNEERNPVQVTPHIQPIDEIVFSNEAEVENLQAAKAVLSDSLDYAYVRDYVPGDPLKTVHWQLSARSENYLTRLYEVYTNPGVAVFMGFYAKEQDAESMATMFDCVVESAFSMDTYAREQGLETEIHYCDRFGSELVKMAWTDDDLPQMIDEMPRMSSDKGQQSIMLNQLMDHVAARGVQNNLIVCTADISAELISLLLEAKAYGKEPILVVAVPPMLVDREKDDYLAPLSELSAADIGYIAVAHSEELQSHPIS